MALLLNCESLSKSYGPRLLFRDISISFDEGERAGLIGPNGSGKSTLMKVFAGIEQPDEGSMTTKRGLRMGYLPQEDTFPAGETVEDVVVAAVEAGHLDEHERIARASILLGKVGFTRFDQEAATLSGGWRKRLAIAREMARNPELLLLDEPTNHLDLEGILWLEKTLLAAPFAYVVVSHDRYFLENVTDRVVELNRTYPHGYLSIDGSYSEFLTKREEFLAAQQARQQSLASTVRREIEWLHRGAKARTTKAKGRIQKADAMMGELAELKTRNAQSDRAAGIDFSATHRQTRKLLVARNVVKRLGDRLLFQNLDLVLAPGTKLGLLGPNGSGKTTLIRVLAGEIEPDAGEITRAEGLRVVRFDQSREQLDRTQTLRQALSSTGDTVVYRDGTMHITSWAKQFLFRVEQLDMPVSNLSGGEQARVLIARLMLRPADLLILDEPTNDLDIPTLDVLEQSLEDFPGALVLVTHDRMMLDRLSTQLLGLDGGGGVGHFADLSQWERAREARREAEAVARKPKATAKPQAAAAGAKKLTYMEQRELEQIEDKIMEAEQAVERAHKTMEDPGVLADREKLNAACESLHVAQESVQKLYARWEELEAKKA